MNERSNKPKPQPDPRLESIFQAFRSPSSNMVEECLCKRVFYNTEGNWDDSEDTYEDLCREPHAVALDHDVVCLSLEGKRYCVDCDCWHGHGLRLATALDAYAKSIARYFDHEARRMTIAAMKARAVIDQVDKVRKAEIEKNKDSHQWGRDSHCRLCGAFRDTLIGDVPCPYQEPEPSPEPKAADLAAPTIQPLSPPTIQPLPPSRMDVLHEGDPAFWVVPTYVCFSGVVPGTTPRPVAALELNAVPPAAQLATTEDRAQQLTTIPDWPPRPTWAPEKIATANQEPPAKNAGVAGPLGYDEIQLRLIACELLEVQDELRKAMKAHDEGIETLEHPASSINASIHYRASVRTALQGIGRLIDSAKGNIAAKQELLRRHEHKPNPLQEPKSHPEPDARYTPSNG